MSINKLNFNTSYADLGLRLRMEDLDTIQSWISAVDRYTLAAFLAPFSKTKVETSPSTLSGITGVLSVDIKSGVTDYNYFRFTTVATDEYMSSPTYADCYINTTAYGLCRVPMGSSTGRSYTIDTYWVVYVYERLSNQVKDVKLRNHYINSENVILFSSASSGATDTLLGTLKIGNPYENNGSLGEIVDGVELQKYNGIKWVGSTSNGVATYGSTSSVVAESNLTFDGTTLGVVGRIRNSDGTAATPTYSFTSDTNTGFYSVGTDQIGISIGGTHKYDINVNGLTVTNGDFASVRTDANARLTLQNGNEANTSPVISLYKGGAGETTIAQVGTYLMISNNPASHSIADLTSSANVKIDANSIDIIGTDMTSKSPRAAGGTIGLIGGTGASGYTGRVGLIGGDVTIYGGVGGSNVAGVADAGKGGDVSIIGGTGGECTGVSYNDGDGGDVYIAGGNKGGADGGNGSTYINFVGPGITNAQGRLFASLTSDNTSVYYMTYNTTTKQVTYGLTTSDIQFKTNLVKIDNSINKINSLNGYTFNFNSDAAKIGYSDTTTKYVGVIAQEVELVMPELVKTNNIPDTNETFKSVEYDKIVALLIEGIKEQQVMINDLTQRLSALEN